MRLRVLQRRANLESVTFEEKTGSDGQGKPTYNSPVSVDARAKEGRELVRDFEGRYDEISLVLWVPGDETNVPNDGDRVTRSGSTFIVEERIEGLQLDGTIDHYKVLCRDE